MNCTVQKVIQPIRLGIRDAAKYTGLSEKSIWNRIKDGLLASHKDGGKRYILLSDLDAMVARCVEESLKDESAPL